MSVIERGDFMAAIRKINREDILNASIEIIKKEGIQKLNARRIAKELGCSTQPIFYIYSNMNEVKEDLLKEISTIFDNALLKSNYDRTVYKDIGKNYIKFAKDEPFLFKLLFNSTINDEMLCFIDLNGTSEKIGKTISEQTGLSKEEAKKFHIKMWLYVNGIANLVANNIYEFSDDEIDELLGEQYISMVLFEIQKGNMKKEVLDNILKNKLKRIDD